MPVINGATNSISGVTISGTPSIGQVLTATGSSAASWAASAATGDVNSAYATGSPATSLSTAEAQIGSVSITPSNTTAKIAVWARVDITKDTGTTVRQATLRMRRGTANTDTQVGLDTVARSGGTASTVYGPVFLVGRDTPGVTTAVTYTVRGVVDAGNSTANRYELFAEELTGPAAAASAINLAGLASARPTAGTAGRLYLATDTGVFSRDNGTSWATIAQPIDQLPTATNAISSDLFAASQSGTVRSLTGTQLAALVQDTMTTRYAIARQFASQSVPTDTYMALTWDEATADTDSMWTVATPTVLTVQRAGLYVIRGFVTFTSNATGFRGLTIVRQNDSATLGQNAPPSAGAAYVEVNTNPWQLSVGAQIALYVYQNAGVTLQTRVGGDPTLCVRRISG